MKKYEKVFLLYILAKMGTLRKPVFISTAKLGAQLNVSPQTISRKLIELEREKLISRNVTAKGQFISITNKGIRELEKFYFELKALLNRDFENILILRGRVFSGLGEGRYYVSLEPYRKQFIEKLGFDPYPGTLNIKLEPECIKYRKILDNIEGIIIEPFKNGKRTYGGGRAFKALIQGKILGAIIIPERTHYGPDVVEIISPVCLRKTLKLRDGDMVILEVRVK